MTTSSIARFYDSKSALIAQHPSLARSLPASQMFTIKLGLDRYRANNPGSPVYDASQGDGGASLGGIPPEEIERALHAFLPGKQTTAYGQPNGDVRVRAAIHENYYRLETLDGCSPENVVLTNGGRPALQHWFQAIHLATGKIGNIIVTSAAPWISYPHGAYLNGFNLLCAPAAGPMDFRVTPDSLHACKDLAGWHNPAEMSLIIATPDNPTGTFYGPLSVINLIEQAFLRGIRKILIDVMYQDTLDDDVEPYNWFSMLSVLPKEIRQCVTLLGGLTKSTGASNCRAAHLWCGDAKFAKTIAAIASHTSGPPNVLGEALMYEVYRQSFPTEHPWVQAITKPTSESRKIFRDRMTELGYTFVSGQGYYAFIDVSEWLGTHLHPDNFFNNLAHTETCIETVDILASYLAQIHGIAVVPGTPFLQPNFIRFSLAQNPELMLPAITRLDEALKFLKNQKSL